MNLLLGTQDKDFFPKKLDDKFNFIKADGFDCYEIDGKLLVDNIDEVKHAIQKSGLSVSSACGGYRGWIGDFIEERRLNAIKDISVILKVLSTIGATGIVIPAAWGMFSYRLPPMVSPRSKEGDKIALLDSLSKLNKVASDYGQYLFLEPLNRYEDHMLNLTKDAASLIEEGGFKNVKITADFYHMSIEEDNYSETLDTYNKLIGHVHVAENHRYQPGTGCLDFKKGFRSLKENSYKGKVIIECRVKGSNPNEDYKKSVPYIRQCWEIA